MFYVNKVFYYLEAQSYLCLQEHFNSTDWFVLEDHSVPASASAYVASTSLLQTTNSITHINLHKIKSAKSSIKCLIFNNYTSNQMWLH